MNLSAVPISRQGRTVLAVRLLSIGEPLGIEPHGIIARPLRGRRALNR